ncbi:NIPSNAP family protein [Pontibacter silvestris]|uniref:NIPSNAP family protein n=1 Tax=Pontibacter silvestris TaxID=2305183 RepID=A0ABW4WY06_9BACT|nr:NIPSNAP family protein [Pontibacter silvestris]MCC9136510.1 NIPSNAP family protein [Pontibacter silvestris]
MSKRFRLLSFCTLCLTMALLLFSSPAFSVAPERELYELKIYHLKSKAQEERVDKFLQQAYIPALHRAGIKKVGVFKPVEGDTAAGKRIYVYIPYNSPDQFFKLPKTLQNDQKFVTDGKDYVDAAHDNPAYSRIETILLQAFPDMPQFQAPDLKAPKNERVYELRSYEGPTEKLYQNKVQMFNQGNEIGIFKRLGFNAVFYAEVLAGSHMPNLMYMTTFENKASRDEHWKAFGGDTEWKKLSAMPEYQNNMSHADIFFLQPTNYSEI